MVDSRAFTSPPAFLHLLSCGGVVRVLLSLTGLIQVTVFGEVAPVFALEVREKYEINSLNPLHLGPRRGRRIDQTGNRSFLI
ncbi:hypothetical protein MHYP_G00179510 [Metynnis hypsauchen]